MGIACRTPINEVWDTRTCHITRVPCVAPPIRRGDDELGNVSPTPFPSPCRRACGSVGRGRPRAKALIRGRDAVPGTHKIERSDRLLARFDLIKISALADVFGAQVVLHGSSVYSYHFVITRINSPFAEFLMMAPEADEVPMFQPPLLGEPAPVNGADAVAGHNRFRVSSSIPTSLGAPDRTPTSQLCRAAAARLAARLTSSGWMPGTAAMAPFDSRVSGAPA
jgi:hypothetical protein